MPNDIQLDQNHRYFINGQNIPGVSEIIESVFPFQASGFVVDRAADFGSAIHKAIELNIKGTLDYATVETPIIPYITQFMDVISRLDILITQCKTEQVLYSKKYKFCGRVDIVEKKIIDIKTGQQNKTHRLQIAAYRHLVQTNTKQKFPPGLIIYLDGTDKDPKVVEEQPNDFTTFLSCLEIYNWSRR